MDYQIHLKQIDVAFFIMSEEFYDSDGADVLREAIAQRKKIILIAHQNGRREPIPREFRSYTGPKALITQQLGTVQAHHAIMLALEKLRIDPNHLNLGGAHDYQYQRPTQ